jgi:hypothetical protein
LSCKVFDADWSWTSVASLEAQPAPLEEPQAVSAVVSWP